MTTDQIKDYVNSHPEEYFTPDGSKKGYVCPLCQSGTGKKGTGLREDKKPGHYKCFSCSAYGDTIDFIGKAYGLTDYPAIIEKASDLYGINGAISKPKTSTSAAKIEHPKADYSAFYKEAHSRIGLTDYPATRGLTQATIERFNLGYVEAWRSPKALDEGKNPPSSPRLIIPTGSTSYVARDTRGDLSEHERSYRVMKQGGAQIFNLEALGTSTGPVYIVEGEIDAMSLYEAGAEAIGLGSTANYKKLLGHLEATTERPSFILSLDNDEAGREATEQIKQGLEALGINYTEQNITLGLKDPNEALTTDRTAFTEAVQRAIEAHRSEEQAALQERANLYAAQSNLGHLPALKAQIARSKDSTALPTGFKQLDMVLDGGLYEGLYIYGAISSLGKTTLVLQTADQLAMQGHDVLIFSLEMARTELMAKSISRHTFIRAYNLEGHTRNAKTGRGILAGHRYSGYNSTELALIDGAMNDYAEYAQHLYIFEGVGNVGIDQIRKAVEEHTRVTGNKPAIIIDYLQILAPYSERLSDKQNTDKAVLELKRISRDHGIPVVAISSLNRQSYKEKISMEAFKESGAIEYSSDVLIGLQLKGAGPKLDVNAAKEKDPREIELVILKNRNGKTGGTIPYVYYPMFNHFEEE